jgi:hypothetical protein
LLEHWLAVFYDRMDHFSGVLVGIELLLISGEVAAQFGE